MKIFGCAVLLVLASFESLAQEPVGSQFTYQGQLQYQAAPATGNFDLQFFLFDQLEGGVLVAGPVELPGVQINDGIFSVELDFGQSVFSGEKLWLELAVRVAGEEGPFTALLPRQAMTATPFAIRALSLVNPCDLENRIYAALPEFERSEACGGVAPLGVPVLVSADGPFSGTTAVDVVWEDYSAAAGALLDEQDCIDLSGLGCEGFYKSVFAEMGISSLLKYTITATSDPGTALFFYTSSDCSAPSLANAVRQSLEDYVSVNGVGFYLDLVLASGGFDFSTMLDLWQSLGVLGSLTTVPVADPQGDILGDIYVPEGTFILSATGKVGERTSDCSNALGLPEP